MSYCHFMNTMLICVGMWQRTRCRLFREHIFVWSRRAGLPGKKKRVSDFTFTHAGQWNFLRRLVFHSILTAESVDSKAAHFISTSHAGEPSTGIRLPSLAGDAVGISSRQKRKRQTGAVLQKWHLRHTSSFPMLFESLKSNNFHHSLIIPNI